MFLAGGSINVVLDFLILALVSRTMALEHVSLANKPEAHSNSVATSDDQSPENCANMHFQHCCLVSIVSMACD